MSAADTEHLFILRLPEEDVAGVKEAVRKDDLGDILQVEFNKDMRHAKVKLDGTVLSAKLVDLPTIVECHKTLDNKTLYKTGDTSQLLICSRDPPDTAPITNIEELPTSKRKEYLKKFTFNHSVTPPLKNVRKRRFKKMVTKKFVDSPEVEKEVKRLLREDCNAIKVSWKVVTDEDKTNEDTQSVMSEADTLTSRGVTPATLQDEDSFTSTPPGGHDDSCYRHGGHSDDKRAELMRLLEEVSSSSSEGEREDEEEEDEEEEEEEEEGEDEEEEEDGEEEEEDEEEDLEVLETEQMRVLSSAVQDLDNQIEEQKLKIQNTQNSVLRGRFEVFLKELERERQLKMEELDKLE